ncbi:unnamed protein product [Paramecium pentaurelia]|uniref:Uncharacterized protein n=1 Tax=Paramecium pentaurelia TaxID=43138 RepID=A0A8S1W988_9CILI|nr:unnamed protein product [Paramecium pentaurelia]
MISPLSIDKPSFDLQKRKPFSPTEITQQQNLLQRKLQQQQSDIISTIQPKNAHLNNNNIQHGLQKLLKTSPYGQLIKQKSQIQIYNQDSISYNYQSGCSPPFQTSHNFFQTDQKQSNSNTQNSIQRRIPSNYRVTLHKKSFDNSSQLISCRLKDQQQISALQQLLQRTAHILQNYKDEIVKYEVENAKLKEKIAILKNS